MKANYELMRIGIKLKTPILLLLLFLASVFQLQAQVPDLISDPPSGHYCPGASPGVKISILGGGAVTYTLWKDNLNTGTSIAGTGSPVTPVEFPGDWEYGTYTLNGPYGAPFTEYLTVYADVPPVAPTSASATLTTICTGGSTELSATGGSGTTFAWYTGSCGGTLVGSSTITTSLTVNPTSTTTYYGRWENVTCYSSCVTITITVEDYNAPVVTPSSATICTGNTATFSVSGGSEYNWSTASCAGSGVTSTSSFTTPVLTSSTTYYVNKVNTACPSPSACETVTVTVDTPPAIPTGTESYDVCVGSTVTMTVSAAPSGSVTYWYEGGCGTGAAVASGTTYVVTPATATATTYYVRNENACDGACLTITVTAYDAPTTPTATVSPTAICSGSSATLTATGGGTGNTLYWYYPTCGTGAIGIGAPVVSPTTTTSTATFTYYVRADNAGCDPSECASVTLTVYPLPTAPEVTAAKELICTGEIVQLTAAAVGSPFDGATIHWYTADGTHLPALTGLMTPTVAPTVTTGYYARFENPACNGPESDVVTITVAYVPTTPTIVANAVPPGTIVHNGTHRICKGTEVILSVTGGGAAEPPALTLNWYRGFSPCAGIATPVATTATYTDRPPSETIYYAQYSNSCGVSGCATITICVDSLPAAPTGITVNPNKTVICEGETLTLTANGHPGYVYPTCTGCPPIPIQATIYWYENSCGTGTAVASGTTITVSPTSTTSYYARYENVCGASACVSVTITVNKVSNPTFITPPQTICYGASTDVAVDFGVDEPSYTYYGTIRWYSSTTPSTCGSGTPLVSTATTLTVSPTVTTYYYVRTENGSCYSTCTSTVVTVVKPLTPTVSASATRVCQTTNNVTLTATVPTGATGVVHWYAGSCGSGTTPGVATGTTYTVAVPYPGQTYYAKMIDATCYSDCASVTVTVDSPNSLTPIHASNNPVCEGSSTTLSTSPSGSAGVLRWYSGSIPCGGALLHEGGDLTVTPVITSRYYARVEGGACPNSDCESITVTLSPLPTTPVITTPNTTICYGGNITLNANAGPVGTTIKWYKKNGIHECSLGDYLGTGLSLTVTPTTGENVFYAQMESAPCTPSACASVTITASANPATPTGVTTDHHICYGHSTTLTATGPVGTTIAWYKGIDPCGGTLLSSGPGPEYSITVSPTETTKYYVRTESTNCTPSSCVSVTVTVDPLPVDPGSIDATATTICFGSSVTMTPHTPSNKDDVAKWYTGSDPCGGTLIATVPGTGALTVTPTLTTLYYVRWSNGCGESNCAQILITVVDPPVAPATIAATNTTICKNQSTTLSVTGGSGATLKWYLGGCGTGTAVGTGTPLTVTITTAGTYVYYARYESVPCAASACKSITITVNDKDPQPTITTTPPTICTGNSTVLNATQATGSIGTLKWYKGTCGGTPLYEGATYTTAVLTQTTYFYVRSENSCGNSDCAEIKVTVDQIPAAPAWVAGPGTMCSGSEVPLEAAPAPTGTITKWYAGGCGIDYIGSGSPITVSPTNLTNENITKYYYARYENTCVSSCKTVTVVVNPANIMPTSITASENPICNGEGTVLSANGGSGVTLKWYTGSGPCGGTFLSSANPLTVTPVLTSRYFARYEGGLCPPSDCNNILITVNDVPQTPTSISAPVTVCSGTTVTLNATYTAGNNVSLVWSTSCHGTPIGTSNNLVVSPTTTTTYYAYTVSEPCAPSACLSVTVTVNNTGTMATVSHDVAICAGEETTLYASVSGGVNNTINWYTGSCGGTLVHTGATLTVSPASTTKYYVRSEAPSCTPTECLSVTVTVNPLPVAPTSVVATLNPVCNGTNTTLSVVGGSGTTLYWYNGSTPCLPPFVATGTTLTVAPTITTIYWASWGTETCGASACVPLTIVVSDVPQVPTSISGPVTICNGNSTTLTASFVAGAGVTLQWYNVNPVTNPGATPVATGGTLIVAPTVTTTYYARTESAGCTPSAAKTVTVTVSDVPTTPTSISGPVTICAGYSTTLTATYTAGAGITLNWYKGGCGTGTAVGTGSSYTVPTTLTVGTHTYYARTESASCTASACLSVTVTVIPALPTITSVTASIPTVCAGSPTVLTANGGTFPATGVTLYWYTGSCGGTLIGTSTSTSSLTVNPTSATTYYARFANAACTGNCASVTVNVTALPTPPTSLLANPNPVCAGSSTTITAIGGTGNVLMWYSGSIPCSGPLLAAGTTSITVFPQINPTQYSAHWVNDCGVSACAIVDVYIENPAVAPTSVTSNDPDNIICVGSSITLTANGGSGTALNWATSCGGTSVGTGTTLTLTPAAGTYTYYAFWTTACGNSACASLTFTVYPVPVTPVINATATAICNGSTVTLEAVNGGGTGSTIKWYTGTCGGTAIATGVTTLVVSPSTTTTYFARYENAACMSECASKTITVYANPVAPTSAATTAPSNRICQGSSAQLYVTGGSGDVLKWYSGTCGGTYVGTGNNLTVSPTNTTTYFARYENGGMCFSTCAQVTLNVYAPNVAPQAVVASATAVCNGSAIQLTAQGGSGTTLRWYTGSCGGTFIGTGISLTVTPTVGTTTYYARWENPVCDPSGCASVTVTTYNQPAPVISGPVTVITGTVQAYSTPNTTGHTYVWSVAGGTITSGQGTAQINVTWGAAGTGTVTVVETNQAPGCSGTATINVTITSVPLYTLSGVVKYDNAFNNPLNGVVIQLKQGSTVVQTATTSTQIVGGVPTPGYYTFTGLVAGNYTMNVAYTGTWGGVNATDALVVEQHDAGTLVPPLSGLPLVAGDVNIDTYVNALDALWIKMRTVTMVNYFPAGDWVFNNAPITLTGNMMYNFLGLCTGDVNQSFIPSGAKEATSISVIDNGTKYVKAGETFEYQITASRSAELGAMTLFMNYDQNLVEIEGVSSVMGEVQSKLDGNQIRVAWSSVQTANVAENDVILTLTMRAKQAITEPAQIFRVNAGSEFANGAASRIDNLNLKMSKLATANYSYTLNNYPNPFKNSTNIVYTLPESGYVKLVVTNMYGEAIRTVVDGNHPAGSHQVTVNASDLNLAPGVYLYKIEITGETNNFSKINKMVFTR